MLKQKEIKPLPRRGNLPSFLTLRRKTDPHPLAFISQHPLRSSALPSLSHGKLRSALPSQARQQLLKKSSLSPSSKSDDPCPGSQGPPDPATLCCWHFPHVSAWSSQLHHASMGRGTLSGVHCCALALCPKHGMCPNKYLLIH